MLFFPKSMIWWKKSYQFVLAAVSATSFALLPRIFDSVGKSRINLYQLLYLQPVNANFSQIFDLVKNVVSHCFQLLYLY